MIKKAYKRSLQYCLNAISLITVMHYVAFRFLQSTMFPFIYTDQYKYGIIFSLVFSGGIRFVYIIKTRIAGATTQREKGKVLFDYIPWIILAIPFIYVGWKHDYKELVFLPIVVLCLYKIDAEKVLRWFTWTVSILLASTIICSLSGAVRNIVMGSNKQVWGAYGTVNMTDTASYFTFLTLFVWCAQKNKNWLNSICLFGFNVVLVFVVYNFTNSRTALYSGIITSVFILWDGIGTIFREKNSRYRKIEKRINNLSMAVFPVIGLVVFVLVFLYVKRQQWVINADEMMSGRLDVMAEAVRKYGIHLFGSTIQTMHGNGATQIAFGWRTNGYGYIDTAYSMLIIRYGVVLFLIIMAMWIRMTKQALQKDKSRIALSMLVIAIHAFSEARFLDVNYNILLVMPFCSFSDESTGLIKTKTIADGERKKNIPDYLLGWIVGIALLLFSYLTLPRVMSYLRTTFYLQNWTSGISSWKALTVCLGLVVLVYALWKSIAVYFRERTIRKIILPVTIVSLLIGCIILGNKTVSYSVADQKERFDIEQQAVQIVQKSASQPVYVAEQSELYQRKFGGFTEHVFSTEELYRNPQGTIFTDVSIESLEASYKDGQYTQISPWSGIYSYDPTVIEALSDAGYEWKPYYYSERTCDLYDLAVRNGLEQDDRGRLILRGSSRSINANLEYDQYWGTYEVRYVIELTQNLEERGKVCTLRIMGEAGDSTILEQPVLITDFDSEGKCSMTVSYHIDSTPKVSFLIIAEDGVELLVDEIAWQRVS